MGYARYFSSARAFSLLWALPVAVLVLLSGCELPIWSTFSNLGSESVEISQGTGDLPRWEDAAPTYRGAVSGHQGSLLSIATTPTSLPILTLGSDGLVLAWNPRKRGAQLVTKLKKAPATGTFGDSHALLATAVGTTVTVSCLAGCNKTWTLTRLKARASSIAFHAHDSAVLIGGADGRVYRWRFLDEERADTFEERERCLERYIAHQAAITVVAAHPFGRAFFSGDIGGHLFAWLPYDADDYGGEYDETPFSGLFFSAKGTYAQAARSGDRGIVSLAVSEDGNRLAVGTEEGHVELWDVRGFLIAARSKVHEGRVYSVALDKTGQTVASAGRDGHVVVARAYPDSQYGIAPDTLKETMKAARDFVVDDVRRVTFLTSNELVASSEDGRLSVVEVPKLPKPVETPTSESASDVNVPLDTDY